MKQTIITILLFNALNVYAVGADSVTQLPNISCITQACPNGNTGGTLQLLGAMCDPNNSAQDSPPETHYFECSWNGSNWTFGNNIDVACSPSSGCNHSYQEWSQQTITKKCNGTPRTINNDFARCSPNGGEYCIMNWSDGTQTYIPSDRTAVENGTNYVTAYFQGTVNSPATCVSEKRFCQDSGTTQGTISGTATYKNCNVITPPSYCYIPSQIPARWKKLDMSNDNIVGLFTTVQTPICPNSKICKKISPVSGAMSIYIISSKWDAGALNPVYSPTPPDCAF